MAPDLAEQYQTDENLRARIETHQRYTFGPPLEPAIDQVLNLNGDELLLDVGTGPGGFLHRLDQAGHRGKLIGIDASVGMIAKATSTPSNIDFFQADAQSLPFSNHSFDVVTARHMLYHVPDVPRSLREIRRVLRPAGRFLAVTNTQNNMAEFRSALSEAANQLTGKIADVLRILIPVSEAFNDQNGSAFIESVFGNVTSTFVNAALRFETAEPALRYFDSCRTFRGFDLGEWNLARENFAEVIARRLSAGPWIVSKSVVLLSATRDK